MTSRLLMPPSVTMANRRLYVQKPPHSGNSNGAAPSRFVKPRGTPVGTTPSSPGQPSRPSATPGPNPNAHPAFAAPGRAPLR
jgi:hypothetical protein